MPSRKKASRAAQLQPQPVHSDYDTDTANNVTDSAPMMAPPPARTNTELNLAALRRYVPDIERIIAIAPFAVVYLFSPETQQWEKSGHEGTLFVCQLSANGWGYPRYNVAMLNRKSLDNFITELVSGENVEITEQYVILQVVSEDGTPDIYGLWIFSDEDAPETRHVVANAIQECAVRAELARSNESYNENEDSTAQSYNLDGTDEPVVEHHPEPEPTGRPIDLLSLFNKPEVYSNDQRLAESNRANLSMSPPIPEQPNRFQSTADTDFFRSSRSPAVADPGHSQPPPQQNALLDLFKSARR